MLPSVLQLLSVPLTSSGEMCTLWCEFDIDPCTHFDTGPVDVTDCDDYICIELETRCSTILDPSDRVVSDYTAITDELGYICPQVSTSPKAYKSDIGEGIEPINSECFDFIEDGADWYGGSRSFDNFFYMTPTILEEACGVIACYDFEDCAEQVHDCELPWLAAPVDFNMYYELASFGHNNCITF